jgi:Fe2+ transport system protein FeoA
MNLLEVAIAVDTRIEGLHEDLREDFQKRLRELGFREGAFVRCLRVRVTPFGGPRVFQVEGSVFSLESSLARHVLVREL